MAVGVAHMFFLQILSYGPVGIILFILATLVLAWKFGVRGMFAGHCLIALYIMISDVNWIQTEMQRPGYDGQPDMDIVFHMGLFARILMINTMLLPFACVGLLFRKIKDPGTKLQKNSDPLEDYHDFTNY